jgi:protein involved in polysaccharide export with SLBB domain
MQTMRFLPSSPMRLAARLAGALALTLAAGILPAVAQTDTSRDRNNDSTSNQQDSTYPDQSTGDNRGNDTDNQADTTVTTPGGPARIRQPANERETPADRDRQDQDALRQQQLPPRYVPGEFEKYVQAQIPPDQKLKIRRFGANLVTDALMVTSKEDPTPAVPGDYIVKPGDDIALTIWGTADADLHVTVDRAGRISVPRIGAIAVGGLRNDELADTIRRRVGMVFKNFELTATLDHVRPVRVFVTGYAQRPGSLTVSGLASVLHAIMRAGGPSAAGSFRDIHLNRGGREVATFDLYDLLLRGDRRSDQLVQPDDVIFIGPIGTQVAVIGSVNEQAIFELKPGETLADVLRMAGGFNAVADRSRVAVEHLADRATGHVNELLLPEHASEPMGTGDLVRVFSAVTVSQPKERQNKRVRVEGEVVHPGDFVLPPGSTVDDALKLAGGLTPAAYPYGTELTRESVRLKQEENYKRALDDLETDMTKNQAMSRISTSEEATGQNAIAEANSRLLRKLRQQHPTGRVVLQIRPDATALPNLALEDGDRINIPSRSTSVGVFGSVFNTGNFIFSPGRTTDDYLSLAGGPTRGADASSMFVIHANGTAVSARQGTSFWHSNNEFRTTQVQPGDTIFVPEEINRTSFVQDAKDWTQILYQFGLGVAGIAALAR